MKGFKEFLLTRKLVPEEKVVYYQGWVSKFTALFGEELTHGITGDLLDAFARHLTKRFGGCVIIAGILKKTENTW